MNGKIFIILDDVEVRVVGMQKIGTIALIIAIMNKKFIFRCFSTIQTSGSSFWCEAVRICQSEIMLQAIGEYQPMVIVVAANL